MTVSRSPRCLARVLVLASLGAPALGQGAPPPRTPASFAATVDSLARPLIEREITVGLVVGILADGETWTRGYGRVALDGEAVPDEDTVYEIGSITKTFVGLLLADAEERGLVALDDPVEKHMPGQTYVPRRDGVLVRLVHLSTHTSGLPRMPFNMRPESWTNPYAGYGPHQLYEGLTEIDLLSTPGDVYLYSNLGFGVLGHVLAVAQETSFEELLRERVLEPLELEDTRITLTPSMRARLAAPYGAEGRPSSNWDFDVLAGCGALRSTVSDLLKYARANLEPEGTGLADAIRAAHVQHHDLEKGAGVALGWHIGRGGRSIWHNGGTGGYKSYLALDPRTKRAIVVLANTISREIDTLGRALFGVVVEGR